VKKKDILESSEEDEDEEEFIEPAEEEKEEETKKEIDPKVDWAVIEAKYKDLLKTKNLDIKRLFKKIAVEAIDQWAKPITPKGTGAGNLFLEPSRVDIYFKAFRDFGKVKNPRFIKSKKGGKGTKFQYKYVIDNKCTVEELPKKLAVILKVVNEFNRYWPDFIGNIKYEIEEFIREKREIFNKKEEYNKFPDSFPDGPNISVILPNEQISQQLQPQLQQQLQPQLQHQSQQLQPQLQQQLLQLQPQQYSIPFQNPFNDEIVKHIQYLNSVIIEKDEKLRISSNTTKSLREDIKTLEDESRIEGDDDEEEEEEETFDIIQIIKKELHTRNFM